ncbi:PREDICTED: uncharacterized protein LOC105362556 [Ceratosolen solmsi marchali]|uniref:Uncharacterized protein LOC105362556 n=1 Tax=Ceratosolen solmsi marchali TaxID=326594 RepID=A0AAJ7DVV3_9HYME|nr:PREDICTED: uncharacterized protein LOC105362556 [Ceratosolen solmsi marchali]
MQQTAQDASFPDVVISSDNCQIDNSVNGNCDISRCCLSGNKKHIPNTTTSVKTKRKARSTRRRLNAMINNTSLHFSDTDSEGELTTPRISITNNNANMPLKCFNEGDLLRPVISVTLDGSDDSSCGSARRGSFIDNLTDVDEIYTSEPENNERFDRRRSRVALTMGNLVVGDIPHQGETDLEDMSNDEEEVIQAPIYITPRADIFCDFNGETITTKEGDGPFSVEVRNQMSIDESKVISDRPDIVVLPTTDSEDMEASDDDDKVDEACGHHVAYENFDVLDASQTVMKNVNKMEQLLSVKEFDDGLSDNPTDIEDIE